MPTLYSYVVEHDLGNAPCAKGRWCTLANCKFSRSGKAKNVVESARVGDWIVGTGGRSAVSSGHGTIIYAMKVVEVVPLENYYGRMEFKGRADWRTVSEGDPGLKRRMALISYEFVYFGNKAVPIPPQWLQPGHRLEKRGPRHRIFRGGFVEEFIAWYSQLKRKGVIGRPCGKNDSECQNACSKSAG